MGDLKSCPNAAHHTPQPEGYIAWFDWAARMHRTHNQILCPGCGRFSIWIPKTKRALRRATVRLSDDKMTVEVKE